MLKSDTKKTPLFDLLLETEEGRQLLRKYFFDGDFSKINTTDEDETFTMLCWFTSTAEGRQNLLQILADESFRKRLLQNDAFIPALLKSVESGELKDTSPLFWLIRTDTGRQILQQLLVDVSFRRRLLQDGAFISILLKRVEGGVNKDISPLFRLIRTDIGHPVLQQIFSDVSFRERLLQDSAFIPALLKGAEVDVSEIYLPFYWLYMLEGVDTGRKILQQILADVSFRERLLLSDAFISALLKGLEGGVKDTSPLYWLTGTDTGHPILQQLLADVSIMERLLQDDAFIPALLKRVEGGVNKDTSLLFGLTGTDIGCQVLQQILDDVSFRERLLQDAAFIPALLKSVAGGVNKDTSPLFWLIKRRAGHSILQQLLADVSFRERLLQEAAFIPALLKSVEDGVNKDTSPLYWLTGMDTEHRILQKLLADVSFREKLLQDSAFIPALLKSVDGGDNKDTSSLFWLIRWDPEHQILKQLLANAFFQKRLLQDPAFIPALLKSVEGGDNKDTSPLFMLIKWNTGHPILQLILADVSFRARLLQDAAFIPAFFKYVESDLNNSYFPFNWLYNFMGTDAGRQILQQILAEESFRERLLQDTAFIPALLKGVESGDNKDTSSLYWLTYWETGRKILQQLLADESFRERLLQDSAFIPALLKAVESGNNKDTSPLYRLTYWDTGCKILQQLLADVSFRERLLQDSAFIPALLKRVEGGVNKDNLPLFKLARTYIGRLILQQLLADVSFRERLLQDAAFIPSFLKSVEDPGYKDTSPLYWLTEEDAGRQILKQLLSDVSFRERLLQDTAFIPALLKSVEGGVNKDTSPLYRLTTDTQGQGILKQMLKQAGFKEALCQEMAFIRGLFLQVTLGGDSAFLNLLNTLGGCDVIQSLMESTHFRANFGRHFDIALPSESLSWVYRSMAGFTLFKLLLQEKKFELLRIPLQALIEHPQIQLYVRQGVLDPSLFLLISATDGGDAYFHYLENPACSPWVMTDRGYSLKDLIESSLLDESEKRKRITALESMIIKRQAQISMNDLVTSPGVLNTELSAAVQPMAPLLPPLIEAEFSIDGVHPSFIQEFQQYISWGSSQENLGENYKAVFQALFNNTIIRNFHDFPIALGDLKKLCLWMNGYLQAKVDIPAPERYWAFDMGHLCEEAVQATFRQMFETLSKESEIALYLEGVANSAAAQYSRVLAIPRNLEIHLRIVRVLAAMGVATTLPTRDPYLRNLSPQRIHSIAQSAMDTLIHREPFIHFLVDRLSVGGQEITYEELIKKYFYYRNSSLFDSEMTMTEFMAFVTGLTAEALGERDYTEHPNLPIRPELNAILTEKATDYVRRLPLYADRELQEQTPLLWQFLTVAPDKLSKEQRELADEFLSRCEQATDGLALIKHCIEFHRDNIGDINIDVFFYKNPQGSSLFSLLIANPLFTEWLFDYKMDTLNREDEPSIEFSPMDSFMSRLRTALFSSEKIADALESAVTQPGTLFFWLYYFQQDAQRVALFQAMMRFIVGSPKRLYTYDSLSPVLFDMLRSTKVSVEHKMLVKTFLEARFSEQVKGCDAHCWLTISLLPSPQEMILTTLRANPWALKTLRNREHLDTLRSLIPDDRVFEEIQTLLQRENEARRGYLMFGAASPDKDNPHKAQDISPNNRG